MEMRSHINEVNDKASIVGEMSFKFDIDTNGKGSNLVRMEGVDLTKIVNAVIEKSNFPKPDKKTTVYLIYKRGYRYY
jgi:hypothetical protein